MSETVREGGCGCGAARYRVTGEPIFVNNCHCRQCQQQTGGTSVFNAFFEAEKIELLSGELSENVLTAGSGGPHIIVRCGQCGIALWSHYPRFGRIALGLRAGTLDEPASFTPNAAIFVAEKLPWVTLPEGIPHFERQYNPVELLAPDKVARLGVLLERSKAAAG